MYELSVQVTTVLPGRTECLACQVPEPPHYTRTCTCSYQNQTSLALVHMPDV